MMETKIKYNLTLYVTDSKDPVSIKAINNLKKILSKYRNIKYKIFDLMDDPEVAERKKIIATPMLIKELPLPVRRIIGDMHDEDKLLLNINIIK